MRRKVPLDPETRKKRLLRRLVVYGALILLSVGFYKFQPIEIDFIPRRIPKMDDSDPSSKKLFAKGTRVMVITAHPDDSEFYIAGTLLLLKESGADIRQLIHTDGDKAYYFWADNRALREIRQREQREASANYGVKDIRFMGYPDGRLRMNEDSIARTAQVIRDWKPDYILAFDGDFPPRASHQDHRRSGDITVPACREAGFSGWILYFNTMAPNFVINVDKVWSQRVDQLAIHKSQFSGEKLKRIQAYIADGAAEQGASKNFTFGEAFRVEEFDGGFQVESKEFDGE